MPRSPRRTVAGLVYRLLSRCVMRLPLFEADGDYLAFEAVLAVSHWRRARQCSSYFE